MKKNILPIYVMLICLNLNPGMVKGNENKQKDQDKEKTVVTAELSDKLCITHHTITLKNKLFKYKATTGHFIMKSEDSKPKATLFFTAYESENCINPVDRPITFCFNGGPGSSSVWLHLGAFGPKKVLMKEDGSAYPPPASLIENQYTLLDQTDIVFIDPVTTGYSRPAPGEDKKQFHGIEEDISSVGEFIRLYTTRFQRWKSPKFLAGESYGTTRAAGLSRYLQREFGMYLNGIILISPVLNFGTIEFNPGNDLPYILFLPSYTAAAWIHKKISPEFLDDFHRAIGEAERFAANEYTLALMKGNKLSLEESSKIAQKLSSLTGVGSEFIINNNLRITDDSFFVELLRSDNLMVGRLDSRFKGPLTELYQGFMQKDPSYALILGPFSTALNHYIRSELNYENDLPYEILTNKVYPWNFGKAQNTYVNVAEDLRIAISDNPYLKVFVASGYFDLATPYYGAVYTINHLFIKEDLLKNISISFYDAGHMMYIHKPSLEKLKRDISGFINSAIK